MACVAMILSAALAGTITVDDFSKGKVEGWQIAGTPEYYKGGFGASGLRVVADSSRGKALAAPIQFTRADRSEVVFLTKTLPSPIKAADVRAVVFWYRIEGAGQVPVASLKVRLRTSPKQFVDIDLYPKQDLAIGRWQRVRLAVDLSQARNVWGWVLDTVKWLTFRLDDVDDRNTAFTFYLSDIQIETAVPPEPYEPVIRHRPRRERPRVLYARHAAAGFYGLGRAIRSALPEADVEERLFRGLHFPLWWQSPPDDRLLAYDLIVMLDVDPFILTWRQARLLADAVASGAHMLWFGGPNTLNASQRPESPVFTVLPVAGQPGRKMVRANTAPEPAQGAENHPLVACVPMDALAPVRSLNPVRPRPGAMTVLKAGQWPLVVTWKYQRGQATVITTWCDGAQLPDFFTAPGSLAWLQRLVKWAAGRLGSPWIIVDECSPTAPAPGGTVHIRARLSGAADKGRVQVTAKAAALPEGVEAPRPLDVREESRSSYSIVLPSSLRPMRLEITASADGSSGSDSVPITTSVTPEAVLQVQWARHKACFVPGQTVDATILVPSACLAANEGGAGRPVLRVAIASPRRPIRPIIGLGRLPASPAVRLTFTVPNLMPSTYWLAAELVRGEETVAVTEAPFRVVDPLELDSLFPIITYLDVGRGGHTMDETMIRQWVDDAWAHGFNTAAIVGLSSLARDELSHTSRLRNYLEAYAQGLGMATIYEYGSFKLLSRSAPTKPCVFSPEYPSALRRVIEPQLDTAARVPRLISVKITDEPIGSMRSIDGCAYCQEQFRQRYGVPLPSLDRPPDDRYLRWALADFIGEYVRSAFAMVRDAVVDARVPLIPGRRRAFDLLLTYMSPGLGFGRPLTGQEDTLDWTAACHRCDFDVYPYFYPSSQRIRMLTAWPCFAYMRAVARYHGRPWGFYVELDDRNWPFQRNPKQASSECAWTAIAQGANYLNSFIHRRFGTGNDCRPERWEHLGRNLRIIRAVGPLLAATKRPAARVALWFPSAQQAIDNGYAFPKYLFAALHQALGACDLVIEEAVARGDAIRGRALVMSGVHTIDHRAIEPLRQWLRNGGILLLDRWPDRDERGHPVNLAAALGIPPSLPPWDTRRCGSGRVIALPADFDRAYRNAVETGSASQAKGSRDKLAGVLQDAGLRPTVLVLDRTGQMEAGLRLARGVAVVTLVNHDPSPNEATVLVRGLPFKPAVVWAVSQERRGQPCGRLVAPETVGGAVALHVALPGHESRLYALWPHRPQRLQVLARPKAAHRGQTVHINLQAQPPGGLHLAYMRVQTPDGVPLSTLSGPLALRNGSGELAWTVPINAPEGEYRIQAALPAFGLVCRARFSVK